MQTSPPPLQTNDKIGICCPAGSVNAADMEAMYRQIRQWGFNYEIGRNVGKNFFKFSANDDDRLAELQAMLDDDSIRAIFFARGGYGMVRIIDRLDFSAFVQKPKWLVGYSDITCLHNHIHSNYGICTLHAHMGSGYQTEKRDETSTKSIYDAITGQHQSFLSGTHALQRQGVCQGQLIGGNLALISDLIGTDSDIDTEGKILFLEDVGEYRYNIDRMMWQLKRSGKLDKLAGLIVGSFTDTQDNEIPFGLTEQEIVYEKIKDEQFPVCFNFPIGHQPENIALQIGAEYLLSVSDDAVQLQTMPIG